jgi:hypothetical protein
MALNYYTVERGINILSNVSSVETQIINGSFDPSSTGLSADVGSLFLRNTGQLYTKTNTGDTDWSQVAAGGAGDIAALSAAIDQNTTDINTVSGDVINNTTDINTVSGDLLTLSGEFVNHTHVKADITDFVESDYVHTTGNETIAGIKTFTDNVIVNGDLTVNGTTTTVSSEDLLVTDNTITLNFGETGAGVSTGTAGIEIDRGTLSGVSLRWNEATDTWQVTEDGAVYYDILHEGNISNNVDITALSAAIDQNTTDINTVSGDVINNTTDINTISGDVINNTTDINTISGDIGVLNSGNYINGVTIGADLTALDNNLFTVSGDLDTAEVNISNNAADILTVSGDLLALEIVVENLEPSGSVAAVTAPTVLDSVPIAAGNVVKWHVYAKEDAAANHRAVEIHAMHDGISSVDFNVASVLKIGSNISGIDYDVNINGANLELTVDASNATTFKYKRIVSF